MFMIRAVLRMTAQGTRVGWIDRNSELSPANIRAALRDETAPPVLAIDDADLYGTQLAPLIRDLTLRNRCPLILLAVRSGKMDRTLNPVILEDVPQTEISMPPLGDNDIDALIDVLHREKRLGILTNKSRQQQRSAFRDQAGRQLLVAMIQATSGSRFEEKAFEELEVLQGMSQQVYAIIALSSAYRFGLTTDEILIACGGQNDALNALDQLVRRHIVVTKSDGFTWARHRVIAEIIRDEMQQQGQLADPVRGLSLLAAAKVSESLAQSARPWRMLRTFINHDFLLNNVGSEFARNLYGSLENILAWNYHFWLQRGSLEVELGDDLALGEHFLSTARSMGASDPYVETEWAYLLFRKAIQNPTPEAQDLVAEATEILEDLMSRTGDPYPYHILGSQGLAWARRAFGSTLEREKYLRKLLAKIEEGCKKSPRDSGLAQLRDDLRREYLSIAVRKT